MKRIVNSNKITAAAATDNDELNDALSTVKEDFDYAISGIEKMARSGAQSTNDALVLVEQLNDGINGIISEIAGSVEEE